MILSSSIIMRHHPYLLLRRLERVRAHLSTRRTVIWNSLSNTDSDEVRFCHRRRKTTASAPLPRETATTIRTDALNVESETSKIISTTKSLSSISNDVIATRYDNNKKTMVVALSGGVDSSVVAALLLQEQLENIDIIHMSNWNSTSQDDDSLNTSCSSEKDWLYVQEIAEQLNLPNVHRCYFESEYWNFVFEPFVQNLFHQNKMNNPDIDCNKYIKFGRLLEYLDQKYNGSNYTLATGHYARLWHRGTGNTTALPDYIEDAVQRCHDDDRGVDYSWVWKSWGCQQYNVDRAPPLLVSAIDQSKDQSYFLAGCTGDSFTNVTFPLGNYHKNNNYIQNGNNNVTTTSSSSTSSNDSSSNSNLTVREMAKEFNLPTATKRDSVGICFVGKRKGGFHTFVNNYLPIPKDRILFMDIETNRVMGLSEYPGHAVTYTIGQGAKMSGVFHKYFVVDKNIATNTVVLCPGTHHPSLYCDSLSIRVQDLNWMARKELPIPLLRSHGNGNSSNNNVTSMRALCRVRHLQPLVDCTIYMDYDKQMLLVHFDKALRGVSPGQYTVFYILDGLICLGGGPIHERGLSYWDRNKELDLKNIHPSGLNDVIKF